MKTVEERFSCKVDHRGPRYGRLGFCWIWTGSKDDDGYGTFRDENGKTVKVHRWNWIRTNGPVPAGKELDHLCNRPSCVRPSHMVPTSHRHNVMRGRGAGATNARKKRCHNGHLLRGANLSFEGPDKKFRRCVTCRRNNQRRKV